MYTYQQTEDPMPDERVFTLDELHLYDGEDKPKYIAYKGVVYDVTDSMRWRKPIHGGMHFPGLDLTDELPDAPHSEEVFTRPHIKRVGILKS
jgi:predicted heme/steroid binding protein